MSPLLLYDSKCLPNTSKGKPLFRTLPRRRRTKRVNLRPANTAGAAVSAPGAPLTLIAVELVAGLVIFLSFAAAFFPKLLLPVDLLRETPAVFQFSILK